MPTIRQIKISHCKSAVRMRNMPKRQDINKIMIIGSGPIIIGQACEFDYSGTQACKALKKLGYEIVLVNSNPATIMTDPDVADITYIEPLNLDRLTQIIEQERPDALLPNLGGQSGLNLCSELDKAGVLKKFNVQVIGVQVDAIERGEDRIEFKNAMKDLGIGMPRSEVAYTIDEAVKIAEELKYPVVLRPAYTMGGAGGGMVYNVDELKVVCERGLQASLVGQVLVEECIFGWEELELEVVRDADNNKITVCFIENIDPIGVHTGDQLRVNTCERDVLVSRLPAEIFPEYILIRVNEFDKTALTPLDEWIEYLKDGTIRPDTTVPGLKEAREKLKYYSMSPGERLVYIRHLEDINIQNDAIHTSKLEGRIEGLAEGKAEGIAEGKAEGLAEGLRQVASKMKKAGVDIATIATCTGLSEETILSL